MARIFLLFGFLAFGLASSASAQIVETRQSSGNPMVEVFKSTIYGGLAGVLLGGALEIAVDDSGGDYAKWGFVTGTFFGFGYGVYHVQTRGQPRAMLQGGNEGWAFAVPELRVERDAADREGPAARALRREPLRNEGLHVSLPLASYRF